MWPVLFNVGEINEIQGVNMSFIASDLPTYYIRNADLNTLRQRTAAAAARNSPPEGVPADRDYRTFNPFSPDNLRNKAPAQE